MPKRAAKKAKTTHTPDELISAIPPPPEYLPLPYRETARSPVIRLPPGTNTDPYSLFKLFLTDKHFETIARNTNDYAKAKDAGSAGKRAWIPTSAAEIKVFVAIFIYMGVVRLSACEDYWSDIYGKFVCSEHMSLSRFEALKRYLHISPTKQANSEDSEDESPEMSTKWWNKLEPIASEFRSSCLKYCTPGINLSVDEMMVRCFGRSKHTFKAPNKPIKEGYKIFALCEAGYTYYFMWSSKSKSYGELVKQPDLTPTESMVYQLAQTLPTGLPYILYMDNLFTRVPLLRRLRAIDIGACGTTRRHPEFPQFLLDLKEYCSKRLEWNTTAAIVVRKKVKVEEKEEGEDSQWESDSLDPGVICYAWQDNNTVIACSTVHCAGTEHSITRSRRRPQITSTNGALVRKVFGEDVRKDLPIPLFIDDYNHFMGGVDIADQLRSYYTTQRITFRTWYPLFFWILDTAILNAYLIGRQLYGKAYMDHKSFRLALWTSLFHYSQQVFSDRKLAEFHSNRPKPREGLEHRWVPLSKRTYCYCCRMVYSSTKKRKFGDEISINGVVRKRAAQTLWACDTCNVPICTESECWDYYHRVALASSASSSAS